MQMTEPLLFLVKVSHVIANQKAFLIPSRCGIPEVMRSIGDANRHNGQPSIFLTNGEEDRCAYSTSPSVFFNVNFVTVDTVQQRRYSVFYTSNRMRVKERNLADFWVRRFEAARSAGRPEQLHFNFREFLAWHYFRAQSHPHTLFTLRIERFPLRAGNSLQNCLIGFQIFNVSIALICSRNVFWGYICQSRAPVKASRPLGGSFGRHCLFGPGKYSAIVRESGRGNRGAFDHRRAVRVFL